MGKLAEPKHALPILEKDIQKSCEDLLLLDGWRIFRLEKNFSEKKQRSFGEKGAPDCMAVRYSEHGFTLAHVLYVEFKRPKGGRLSTEQKLWHAAERERGAITWIAGEQFQPSYESFKRFYQASGLCKRRLL